MKLSKSTQYAINWLFANGSDMEQIADELKLDITTVKKHVEKNNIQKTADLATKSEPVKSSKDLMIRHTKEKHTNNVSIMTREASAYNDNAKKKFNDKEKNISYIFKPNNE